MIPDRRHLAQLSRPSVLSKTVLAMAGSVSAAVDSLRAALDEQRRKAKATARRLLQQELKSKLMDSKASSARQKAMDVAHILFSMSYPDHADAEEYLKSRPNNLFPEEPAELRRRLELRFARSDVQDLNGRSRDTTRQSWRRSEAVARRYLRDRQLLCWVQQQNACQGIAPSGSQVVRQRDTLQASLWATSWSQLRSHCSAGGKKMLQRFRQRWGIAWGTLPARHVLPQHQLQAKASAR